MSVKRVLDYDQATSAWYLCLIQALNGDLTDLQRSAQRCISLSTESTQMSSLTTGRYFLGATHYLRNELTLGEPPLNALFEDLYSARSSYVAHGSVLLSLLYTAQGRAEEAVEIVDRLVDYTIETQRPLITALARAFQVELALRHGRLADALHLSDQAEFDRTSLVWFLYVPQFTEVKLLLAKGEPKSLAEAGAKLDKLEEFLRANHRKFLLIDLLALQALRFHALGKKRAAFAALNESLTLAARSGAVRSLVDHGEPMADLLRRMQERTIDPALADFHGQVLAAFEITRLILA